MILQIMGQTVCLVFNSIMDDAYTALFNCAAVVQASESLTAATLSFM